jgi:hypothetical protein
MRKCLPRGRARAICAVRRSTACGPAVQATNKAESGIIVRGIMQEEDVLSEFRASQALLEGHFLLSSGRHSAFYLQCARVLMDPMRAARLATAIAQKLPRDLRQQIQKVVSRDGRRDHRP